jgi:hypothetical protein
MVHQKAFREIFISSRGMNQKAMTIIGIMKRRRLTV